MNNNNERYFFCYDSDLARIIKSKGFNYITRAKHYATDQEFTLFLYDKEMQQYIDHWNRKKVK